MTLQGHPSISPPRDELRPAQQLRGEVTPPSDKSIAHRALMATAIAHGQASLAIRWPGLDVMATLDALRVLGADIGDAVAGEDPEEPLRVHVRGLGSAHELGRLGAGEVDCRNSGTTMRLLSGLAAAACGPVRLTGDDSLSRRPMERVAQPLRRMGVEVTTSDGRPPLLITGRRSLTPLDHRLDITSAQVLGAISFAALYADGPSTIEVPGPTRDHTERLLSWLGAAIERREGAERASTVTTIQGPAVLRARDLTVPGDPSSATPWLVAAALHPGASLTVRRVMLNPSRLAVVDVLRQMGAAIDVQATPDLDGAAGEPIGDITVTGGAELRAVDIRPPATASLIDELPLLAIAMAGASGTSQVTGAGELRNKESDRVAATTQLLDGIGASVQELPTGWRVSRGRPRAAVIATQGDHRIAIAAAVAAWTGLATGVTLDDAACVAVSYPTFWRDARGLACLA